eukprot:scaffold105556_cov30-Tisochrysis_lutea.AAC.1
MRLGLCGADKGSEQGVSIGDDRSAAAETANHGHAPCAHRAGVDHLCWFARDAEHNSLRVLMGSSAYAGVGGQVPAVCEEPGARVCTEQRLLDLQHTQHW